jgi:hypothetical protein
MAIKRRGIAVTGVCVVSLAVTGTAMAASGVDQYSNNLPTPGGSSDTSGTPPTSSPGTLPPSTQNDLQDLPKSQRDQLSTVATSKQLGAPDKQGSKNDGSDESNGVPASALDAVGSAPGVALLATLVAIAGLGAIFRLRGRRGSGLDPAPDV